MQKSALAALLLITACDPMPPQRDASVPEDTGTWVPTGDPGLEVGTGIDAFASFDDGDTLEIVGGSQGAQHIWVALRLFGLDPRGTIVDLQLLRDRDGMRVSQTFRVRLSFDPIVGEVYAEVTGLTLVVPEPDQAIGEDLTLRVSITERPDSGERTVERSRPIRAAWAPGEG